MNGSRAEFMAGKIDAAAHGDLREASVWALRRAAGQQEHDPEIADANRMEAVVYALLRIGDALEARS